MDKHLVYQSSFVILLLNLKIEHLYCPWKIDVDLEKELITISKRNLYYFGTNTDAISFRFIRRIKIDEHVFGADISIRTLGGTVTARYLPKKGALEIRKKLFEYNTHRSMGFVFG